MKRIFLLMLLIVEDNEAFAVDISSSQTQTSTSTKLETQAFPQITSQAVAPTTSQEAITACSGLYEKDSCQFHTSNALLTGSCKILPSGSNNYELGCQTEQTTKNPTADTGKDAPNMKEPHQHKHKRS